MTLKKYIALNIENNRKFFIDKYKNFILREKKIPFILYGEKTYGNFLIDKKTGVYLLLKEKVDKWEEIHVEFFDDIKTQLRKIIPAEYTIPSSYQIIGHICHLNLEKELYLYRREIGEIFLKNNKSIQTVVLKKNNIDNIFRNSDLEVIAGKYNLKTYHYENNNKFFIDYEHVYWNSKLQNERKILLKNFNENDVIVDAFCGVGPLVIPSLKMGCKVYCNDLNERAIDNLKKNLQLNRVEENCIISNICAKKFLQNLPENINHIFFNLPERSLEFVKYIKSYKKATLHAFFFCKKKIDSKKFIEETYKIKFTDANIRIARNVAPNKNMLVLTVGIENILFN